MIYELFNDKHELDDEEKDTLCRLFQHDMLQDLLLEFLHKQKDIENLFKVLSNVKSAYAHMVANKNDFDLVYRNVVLSSIVSTKNGASQSFISKTLGANRYSLREVVVT
jgi:hypothetical protein